MIQSCAGCCSIVFLDVVVYKGLVHVVRAVMQSKKEKGREDASSRG